MTTLLNTKEIEEAVMDYDNIYSNPFEFADKLQELVSASDNRFALVKDTSHTKSKS